MSSSILPLAVAAGVGFGIGYYYWNCSPRETSLSFEPLGIVPPSRIIDYPSFRIVYDTSKRIPAAVEEYLTKSHLSGDANRSSSRFHEDKNVRSNMRSTLDDYQGTFRAVGTHRGHMSAAGNHKGSQESMDASFALSNICPQDGDNNSDLWNTFEEFTRELVRDPQYDAVRVISGGLVIPDLDDSSRREGVGSVAVREVNYVTVGPGRVVKPTHLYKVICCESRRRSFCPGFLRRLFRCKEPVDRYCSAFVMRNDASDDLESRMADYQISLRDLEALSGLVFGELSLTDAQLSDETGSPRFEDLCSRHPACSVLSKRLYDKSMISRKLSKALESEPISLGWLTSIEGQLSRKKLSVEDFDSLETRISEAFAGDLDAAIGKVDSDPCQCALDLMRLDRSYVGSEVLQSKLTDDQQTAVVDALKSSLQNCHESSVRDRASRVVKSHYSSDCISFLKREVAFVKILDL